VLEEADGEAGFCLDAAGGEQVAVGELVVVAAEVIHLDQPLLHQRLEAVVGFAQADAHRLGHFPLLYGGVGFDELEQLVVMGVGKHGARDVGMSCSEIEPEFSRFIWRWQLMARLTLNHPIVAAVDGYLRTRRFREQRATHLGGQLGDVAAGDLGF